MLKLITQKANPVDVIRLVVDEYDKLVKVERNEAIKREFISSFTYKFVEKILSDIDKIVDSKIEIKRQLIDEIFKILNPELDDRTHERLLNMIHQILTITLLSEKECKRLQKFIEQDDEFEIEL